MTGRNPYAANPAPRTAGRGASGGTPARKWVKWLLIAVFTLPVWLPLLIFFSPAIAAATGGAFFILWVVRASRKTPPRTRKTRARTR